MTYLDTLRALAAEKQAELVHPKGELAARVQSSGPRWKVVRRSAIVIPSSSNSSSTGR